MTTRREVVQQALRFQSPARLPYELPGPFITVIDLEPDGEPKPGPAASEAWE